MIRNPTTTAERERDPSTVRARVRDGYTRVAEGNSPLGTNGSEAEALARTFGYTHRQLEAAPRDANLGLGCGNPTALASLRPGDVVLDLGCGAGLDAFLASREVGPEGRVIGVDMTEAMLAKARENARREGFANVEFRQGTMEALPVESESVDVIVSNCAINLSPEKDRVFHEAHRVLRPGGVMMVSDVVLEQTLPQPIAASLMAYLGCVGGALPRERYLQLIWDAGFAAIDLANELSFAHVVEPDDARVQEVVRDAGVELDPVQIRAILETIVSVNVRAVK